MRLIDADALLHSMCCLDGETQCDTEDCIRYKERKYIEAAQTIESEPVRHGWWVSEKVRKPNWKGIEHDYFQPNSCSVCHTGFAVRTNFCPNCGARMDGGAENEIC